MQGYIESMIHEIQTADSIHLSDKARKKLERIAMKMVSDVTKIERDEKQYWKMEYLRGGK